MENSEWSYNYIISMKIDNDVVSTAIAADTDYIKGEPEHVLRTKVKYDIYAYFRLLGGVGNVFKDREQVFANNINVWDISTQRIVYSPNESLQLYPPLKGME